MSAPPRVRPGQTFGPYRIGRLLGKGGMGEVYEAEHLEQQRRVALKILSRGLDSDVDRERFLREGRLAAALSHPHTVYVFGSAEIAGILTIAMELVPGGTLRDLVVTKGPLPVREAVDKILDVIDGLQAAQAAGILHRDIKPSNCFVEPDGTVKVGDFGLSISTLSPPDHRTLGEHGKRVGTPSFAAPEQLKGEPLDLRADIYAVGGTLFYLLTGRVPFEGEDVVQLIARVLSDPAASPRTLRPAIPTRLAAVILQCLAKNRDARPADYATLAGLLRPFSSTARVPASLGTRVVAFWVDSIAIVLASLLIAVLGAGLLFLGASAGLLPPPARVVTGLGGVVLMAVLLSPIAGFVWCEGRFGAGPGKTLCGLRVVAAHPGVPSLPRAFARFGMLTLLIVGLPLAAGHLAGWPARMGQERADAIMELCSAGMIALLFITARRRNGYAAIHELVSGTRTIVAPAGEAAPSRVDTDAERFPDEGPHRIGPYSTATDFAGVSRPATIAATDAALRRPVWIHLQHRDAPAVPAARRDLARLTRLRWLNGVRTSELTWDAYESPGGHPCTRTSWPNRRGRWSIVRIWLRDLASEIGASQSDGTTPALRLDRVWIDARGRARLLDFDPPAVTRSGEISAPVVSAKRLLFEVAAVAAGPTTPGKTDQARLVPPPLRATTLLAALDRRQFDSVAALSAAIDTATSGPPALSRGRRAAQLAIVGYTALQVLLLGAVLNAVQAASAREEEIRGARAALALLSQANPTVIPPGTNRVVSINRGAIETFAAGRFAHFVTPRGRRRATSELTSAELASLAEIVARRGRPTDRDYFLASRAFERSGAVDLTVTGPMKAGGAAFWRPPPPAPFATRSRIATAGFFSVPVVLVLGLAALSRGGIGLRLIGAAVVDDRGLEISRSRAMVRTLLAALPLAVYSWATLDLLREVWFGQRGGLDLLGSWQSWTALAALLLFVVAWISALVHPERGLLDRMTRTWIVPR